MQLPTGHSFSALRDMENAPEIGSRFYVRGVPISVVDLGSATRWILSWAGSSPSRMVFVREVASLMAAASEPKLRALHSSASLVVPDGMPLVWIGRLRGFGSAIGRVAGADLVDAVCAAGRERGIQHYFYGGAPGVAEEMALRLRRKYRGLAVVGVFTPPMREIDANFIVDADLAAEMAAIAKARANIVWVGISSPKQEYWMAEAVRRVPNAVFIGVGAAFNFHSGHVRRAPKLIQSIGLEWLHRLTAEPRRLWRRYLILVPQFAPVMMTELVTGLSRRVFRRTQG